MGSSDFIRLYEDADERQATIPLQPWLVEWPPPERIGLLVGKGSDLPHRLVIGEQGEKEVRQHVVAQGIEFEDAFVIRWYERTKCSQLTDEEIAEMSHVARGAHYVREGVDGTA